MRERASYITEPERQRRYGALRQLMDDAGCVAAVIIGTPHVGGKRYFRYFTDWPIQSIGGYLLVGADGWEQAVFRASSQAFWAGKVDFAARCVGWPRDRTLYVSAEEAGRIYGRGKG